VVQHTYFTVARVRSCDCAHFYRDRPRELLRLGLNSSGVVKYSDVGPVEGYVSETVQDRSRLQLMRMTNTKSYPYISMVLRRSSDPPGRPPNKGSVHKFGKTVYISEVNGTQFLTRR